MKGPVLRAAFIAAAVAALAALGSWRGTTAGPEILFGDANCDRNVDSIDALLIKQYHAELLDGLPCQADADINENGIISALDAQAILQQHAGLIPPIVNLLIDATHDGGIWWFPQTRPFDSREPHQGQLAADYMRSLDMKVVELPRGDSIDLETLLDYDVVMRANGFGPYETSEIDAYLEYVDGGGRILLVTSHHLHSEDDLADAFGLAFRGITRSISGSDITLLDRFEPDDITQGVTALVYRAGSALISYPEEAQILGYICETCYVDLNYDEFANEDEPFGPPVLGVMNYGAGAIVFLGDTNLVEAVPQPLTDNILRWLQE